MNLDRHGQEFKAPATPLEAKLPNKNVDFIGSDLVEGDLPTSELVLYNSCADYYFSSHGAVLNRVEFKNHKNSHQEPLRTTFAAGSNIPGFRGGAFLLAFEQESPLNYAVAGQGRTESGDSWIKFKASTEACNIVKTFQLSSDKYIVNLQLEIEPKKHQLIKPRIWFDSPMLLSLKDDVANGLLEVENSKGLQTIDTAKEGQFAWKFPTLFGVKNRYFLNALLLNADQGQVVRSYFKRISNNDLVGIVELPELTEPFKLDLNFYVGPKSVSDLKIADSRLLGVLDFGWFDWICEMFIRMMEFLHRYLGNYGLVIILMALLVRLLFSPLGFWARRTFNRISNFERRYAPEIAAINRQWKDDWVRKGNEVDAFYTKHGRSQTEKMYNLIPLLVELPLVIATYKIFGNYIAFYNAPLLFWIKDLSLRDPFFILPLLFGAASIARESLFNSQANQGAQFFSLSRFLMPTILVVIFANFSSGLVLYMFFNTMFVSLEAAFYDKLLQRD